MKVKMNKGNVLWLATIAYASLLMWLAIANVPSNIDSISAWHLDKLGHAAAYSVLGVLLARSLWLSGAGLSKGLVAGCAIAIAVGYGVITERIQTLISWRSLEGLDAAADAVGALVGGIVWSRLEPRKSRED
jgi:VanZ family protein